LTIKEDVMAVLHREPPKRIPWLIYDIPYPMLPRGSWERELRNKGLGLIGIMGFYPCGNVYLTETPNVVIEKRPIIQGNRTIVTTIYHTPVGDISKKEDWSISPPNPWILEYPIKSLSDFEVLKFIIEDTIYRPNYEAATWVERHIGDDGYVKAGCRSPFQSLLLDYMGYKTLAMAVYRHRKEFESLLKVMEKKYFEVIQILADSPVKVIEIDSNINGRVTSPTFFEKYLLPVYKKANEILHQKDKVTSAHMDGALSCLKDLIPKTGLDMIEAFTPPPVGDLSLSEARAAWGHDIIISANFPETECIKGVDTVKQVTKKILKEVAPGDCFMLTVTEDIPYKAPNDILEPSLRAITNIMWKYGKYPLKL